MDRQEFIDEAEIMKELQHPCLLRLMAVSTKEEPIYIITELMENGALNEFLSKREKDKNPLKVEDLINMGTQVMQT